MVLRATYEASIKLSVESVAESVISVYNLHNSKVRNIGDETANNELFIAFNGPEIGEADETLAAILDLHFAKNNGQWHFTTNTLFKMSGPTVQKMLQKKINLVFIKKYLFLFIGNSAQSSLQTPFHHVQLVQNVI